MLSEATAENPDSSNSYLEAKIDAFAPSLSLGSELHVLCSLGNLFYVSRGKDLAEVSIRLVRIMLLRAVIMIIVKRSTKVMIITMILRTIIIIIIMITMILMIIMI